MKKWFWIRLYEKIFGGEKWEHVREKHTRKNSKSKIASGYGRLYFSNWEYNPVPGVRKSGIPALVEIPAPDMTMMFEHLAMYAAAVGKSNVLNIGGSSFSSSFNSQLLNSCVNCCISRVSNRLKKLRIKIAVNDRNFLKSRSYRSVLHPIFRRQTPSCKTTS